MKELEITVTSQSTATFIVPDCFEPPTHRALTFEELPWEWQVKLAASGNTNRKITQWHLR